MKSRHPIDEFFRNSLRHQEVEPPMHLWDNIVQERAQQVQGKRTKWFLLATGSLSFIAVTIILATLAVPAHKVSLGSFPIPVNSGLARLEQPAKVSEEIKVEKHETAAPVVQTTSSSTPIIKATLTNTAAPTVSKLKSKKRSVQVATVIPDAPKAMLPKPMAHLTALPLINNSEVNIKTRYTSFPDKPKCAKFNPGHWGIYLDIMASPDITFRRLRSKESQYIEYAESRDATESPYYNFSTSLRVSAVSSFGLALRTGVNFSQISERFDYENGGVERTIIEEVKDASGNIIDYDTIVEVGTRIKTTYNTFQTLDIPIIVGYEYNHKNFTFTANGGAYINLLFRSEGDFLSPDENKPVSFSPDDPDAIEAFKEQVGIGWYGSLGVLYHISPKLSLQVEPHFKIYPQPVTKDQYILDQNYLSAGVFIGLRHQF